jgi:PKD domain
MNNCILFYNTAATGPNYYLGTFNYCCALPLPAGLGNISSQPQLASTSHLSANSPCRGAGSSAYANGVDIDGQPWASPPSIGCDEYYAGGSTGSVTVAILNDYTNVAPGFNVSFTGLITGPVNESVWNFGDGVTESNQPYASHQWQSAGSYLVTLTAFNDSYPNGIIATQEMIIGSGPCYVALTSTNPVPPYSSWDTAATNIQDAVDAAPWGGFIVVSNGIYSYGGRATSSSSSSTSTGGGSNRVTIAKAVTVQSVNGPASTFIQGYQVPGTIIGTNAIRCVWLTNGAVLSGFTLTNGATARSNVKVDGAGGGAFSSGVISNCVFVGNIAASGAGVFGGTVNNCVLIANATTSGGEGGGAWFANLNNCLIASNSAPSGSGGGLGTYCNATNCTVVFNSANSGGGSYGANLANCIVYSNSGGNFDGYGYTVTYCCTTPLPSLASGTGNITNAPAFVNAAMGNFRLQSTSPCINSGNNAYVTSATDLDGNPRIAGGTVDIGAYEYQTPTSVISYAFLQQYKLPTDGSVDFKDLDGTAFNVYQDWIAGLNPTNPASILAMLTPVTTNTATGVTVTWQSVSGISYFLQRSTNLLSQPPFATIQSNITGLINTNATSYTDTSATNNVPYFYRVGVVAP